MAVSREICTSSDCNSCKPRFGHLPLGQVADEAGEETPVARFHFADRKLHRKGRAVLALADDHAADADDAALAGGQIALQVAVMVFAIGRRHQASLTFCPMRLGRAVAEQPLGRAAEGLDDAALVDDDHRFRHGVENRLQMRFARQRIARHEIGAPAAAVQQFAAPGHADGDDDECGAVDQRGARQRRRLVQHEECRDDAERGRQQAGPEAADAGRNQHRWQKIQKYRVVGHERRKQGARRQGQGDHGRSDAIAPNPAALLGRKNVSSYNGFRHTDPASIRPICDQGASPDASGKPPMEII